MKKATLRRIVTHEMEIEVPDDITRQGVLDGLTEEQMQDAEDNDEFVSTEWDVVFEPETPPNLDEQIEEQIDATVRYGGSIVLVYPLTRNAEVWLRENTDGQWFGNAIAVEPRYLGNLLAGMEADGLNVQR